MQVETERLLLVPLTAQQLRLWTQDMQALEQTLHCQYRAEPMEGMFREIVESQAQAAEIDAEAYAFYTFWFLIRKEDRIVVGSAGFKGKPDARGEIEIGYGLGSAYTHQGYMTEAVRAMCAWAKAQPGVRRVTAETDADGIASQKILQKCGFVCRKQGETYWWETQT